MSQPTVEATRPADQHQAGQAALVALIPAVLAQAWPLLDLHNLQATLPQFEAAVRAIVARYGQAAAAGALDYYRAERLAQHVPGRAPLQLAPPPADSVIEDAVSWATSDLYGPVTTETTDAAKALLDESVTQLVLDQGRDTIISAVRSDKYAKGWARVTEPGACSFCVMLALRAGAGFLYHKKSAAEFQAHDNCRCSVEPVWNAYEPSAHLRQMQKVWVDSTKGRSGADARAAFRQALEGRPIVGKSGPLKKVATLPRSTMTRAQAEKQLAALQGMKDSPYRTKQMARLERLLKGQSATGPAKAEARGGARMATAAAAPTAARLASLQGRLRALQLDPKRYAIDIANLQKRIAALSAGK